ncbi:MAG: hypothetical protein A3J74_02840 [Elusimicrobia bacterium RIFCSPHIGHO2_02_FULL_57_9]|nr:MAG: hypothetical protein A3J74_02840 [Elusimicrobia bacterium RIFCSPHIGHO2_02_FULL_57_9]
MTAFRRIARDSSWLYLVPVALFVMLRWPLLSFPPYGDEDGAVIEAVLPLGELNFGLQPILSSAFYRASYLLTGWDHLRWVPFLFSLGVLVLTFLLAKDLLGKRGGVWSAALLAISPWNVFFSTHIYIDGSILAFFVMALLYLYHKMPAQNGKMAALTVLCGVCFGLMWLTKYSALVFLAGVGLHSLLTRGFMKSLKTFGAIFLIGAALFYLYPLIYPGHYQGAAHKTNVALSTGIAYKLRWPLGLYGRSFSKAFIYMGPLFLWGFLRALLSPKDWKHLGLPLCLCLTYIGVVFLLLNPDATVLYWSPLAPLFSVFAARALLDTLGSKPALILAGPAAAYAAVLAAVTTLGPHIVQSVHPSIHWSWEGLFQYLPIRIFFGPSLCLYVKPAAILFGFIGFFLFLSMPFKAAWTKKHALALGLGYLLFYSVEYSYAMFSPKLHHVSRDLVAEMKGNVLKQPVYLHGYGAMACQMEGIKVYSFMYDVPLMPKLMKLMDKTKGTVVLLNAPAIGPDTDLRRFLLQKAVLTKTLSDKSVVLAEVWNLN